MWITRESILSGCPVTLPLSHSMREKPNYLGLLRTGMFGVLLEMRDFIIVRQLHLWIHSAAGSSFINPLKILPCIISLRLQHILSQQFPPLVSSITIDGRLPSLGQSSLRSDSIS